MSNEILRKEVLYRAKHRGCKETDFLIGKFVEENLAKFSAQDLELLSRFLQEDDLEIYDWILSNKISPRQYLELLRDIQKFHLLGLAAAVT